jgi:hypothetical protein
MIGSITLERRDLIGSYDKLAAAYDAIHLWRAATGRAFGGRSWEIYGDWTDDTTKLETQAITKIVWLRVGRLREAEFIQPCRVS